ncbi:MAG: zinc metallopeptidase [Eubacteriales bacterium]|nr:zinc metallopeptidase [Eubacteriales bacterium]
MFYYFDPTFIILIPAMILAFIAQGLVQSRFKTYMRIDSGTGLTGAQAARRMLDMNGLTNVGINQIPGTLSDYYNPSDRTINLSADVLNGRSVSAVAVACHEAGHALQHAKGYVPLKIRDAIVPITNIASSISWVLIMVGLGLAFSYGGESGSNIGLTIMDIGILAFCVVLFFHLITLPVEFNASGRALQQIQMLGLVSPENQPGCRKVLSAAAMTYVAALATALANLLRLLVIRNSRD